MGGAISAREPRSVWAVVEARDDLPELQALTRQVNAVELDLLAAAASSGASLSPSPPPASSASVTSVNLAGAAILAQSKDALTSLPLLAHELFLQGVRLRSHLSAPTA